jgi:YgiT-type zinc finger domain-containing protein
MKKQLTMKDEHVTYTLEKDGKFYIIENVPVRVCVETGEEFFAPDTVDRLQRIILAGEKPKKTIETPIFEFAA